MTSLNPSVFEKNIIIIKTPNSPYTFCLVVEIMTVSNIISLPKSDDWWGSQIWNLVRSGVFSLNRDVSSGWRGRLTEGFWSHIVHFLIVMESERGMFRYSSPIPFIRKEFTFLLTIRFLLSCYNMDMCSYMCVSLYTLLR